MSGPQDDWILKKWVTNPSAVTSRGKIRLDRAVGNNLIRRLIGRYNRDRSLKAVTAK
jgi:hypothetical protein